MKLLRVGIVVMVVGVSFLVAAYLRARPVDSGYTTSGFGLIGPLLLEPRETLIALRQVDPPASLTLTLFWQSGFDPDRDIGKTNGAFSTSGLAEFDTLVFDVPSRGQYYIVLTNETGQLTGTTGFRVEQRGFASDFLLASEITIAIGIGTIVMQVLLNFRKKRVRNKHV